MKRTLSSRFLPDIQPFLVQGAMPHDSYRSALHRSHSETVDSYLNSVPPNRVLGAPAVSQTQSALPRPHRTTLAQLRSGFCSSLCSYRARIGLQNDASCPECGAASHDTTHLFNCPSFPTDLSPESLWTDPTSCSIFLSSIPSFSYLAPVQRPPPEPPPGAPG